jgi:hypothetical protein
MQKNRILTITIAGIFLVGVITACNRGFRHGGFDAFDLAAATDRIAYRLDLTDAQKADFKQMADFASQRLIAFHATLTPVQREKIATHIEDHTSDDCRFGWR